MMSGMPLETCWAFDKFWNNKFNYKVASCWFFLLIHTTMHGSMNIEFEYHFNCCDDGVYSLLDPGQETGNGAFLTTHLTSILLLSRETKKKPVSFSILTISDLKSDLVCLYVFPVLLWCRKTSDAVFVAFVRPLSEPVRRFSSCSTDFSQQISQGVLFLYLHVFLF
jgi:hypothetical protein